MSKEIRSKKYQGVYYREVDGGRDRSYFLRLRLNGKMTRIPIGKKSEGVTEAFCNQKRIEVINAARFGETEALMLQRTKKEDPTFEDLFKFYLKNRQLKESTVTHFQVLKKVPFWKSRKITRQDVQDYLDSLAGIMRPATIALRFRQVRAVMRYAIQREKYRYPDPTIGIDLPKSSGPRKRYLTPEEISRLLEAVRHDERLYLFVKLSLCTGARIGTVMSIHSENIAPDGSVRLYNQKSDRWYMGSLDNETTALVRGKIGYVLALKGKEDRVPPMQSIQYKIQAILNELFNDENTPVEERAVVHTLRHSVGTELVRQGVPIEVISKVLDHSSPVITAQVYAKVPQAIIKSAVKNLWK